MILTWMCAFILRALITFKPFHSTLLFPQTPKMVDYKRFSSLMDEGPAIDTKDLETIGKNIRPMEDAIRLIKESHASIVSIGEGSHGTKEFYEFRCEISKQLIIDGRIDCVLLE